MMIKLKFQTFVCKKWRDKTQPTKMVGLQQTADNTTLRVPYLNPDISKKYSHQKT
jgi:hypothetical protein